SEVPPEAERDRRQLQPAPPSAAIPQPVIAVLGGRVDRHESILADPRQDAVNLRLRARAWAIAGLCWPWFSGGGAKTGPAPRVGRAQSHRLRHAARKPMRLPWSGDPGRPGLRGLSPAAALSTPRSDELREVALCGLVAAVASALVVFAVPRGGDLA